MKKLQELPWFTKALSTDVYDSMTWLSEYFLGAYTNTLEAEFSVYGSNLIQRGVTDMGGISNLIERGPSGEIRIGESLITVGTGGVQQLMLRMLEVEQLI